VTTTTPADGAPHRHAPTASGAKLAAIPADVAEAFLARLGEHGPASIEAALGAHEDSGTLIGVAAFGDVSADHGSFIVAVVPDRRRLKIGSDLLHALVADAARSGVRWFQVSYPAGAADADALARSCGLTIARRVGAGTVTAVLDTARCPPSE